jgi:hypothetical protein
MYRKSSASSQKTRLNPSASSGHLGVKKFELAFSKGADRYNPSSKRVFMSNNGTNAQGLGGGAKIHKSPAQPAQSTEQND